MTALFSFASSYTFAFFTIKSKLYSMHSLTILKFVAMFSSQCKCLSKQSDKVRVSCLVVNSITVCSYDGESGLRLAFECTDVKLPSVVWCLMFDIGWANRGST